MVHPRVPKVFEQAIAEHLAAINLLCERDGVQRASDFR
jgi:hypothetical protein